VSEIFISNSLTQWSNKK